MLCQQGRAGGRVPGMTLGSAPQPWCLPPHPHSLPGSQVLQPCCAPRPGEAGPHLTALMYPGTRTAALSGHQSCPTSWVERSVAFPGHMAQGHLDDHVKPGWQLLCPSGLLAPKKAPRSPLWGQGGKGWQDPPEPGPPSADSSERLPGMKLWLQEAPNLGLVWMPWARILVQERQGARHPCPERQPDKETWPRSPAPTPCRRWQPCTRCHGH